MLSRLAIVFSLLIISAPAHAQWFPWGLNVGGVEATGPRLAPDGSGGAIFAWNDDGFEELYGEVYIQRVTIGGIKQWTCCGKPICTQPFSAAHQSNVSTASDGAGGVIVVWLDSRNEGVYFDIYAQRFDASGTALWSAGGVPVVVAPHFQWHMVAIPDGSGGAIIAWADYRNLNDTNLYAQRINAAGASLWNANGVSVCAAAQDQERSAVIPDGAGGAWISWQDRRAGSDFDIYARRVDAAGVPLGVADGIAICTTPGFQLSPAIASDGSGGAAMTWYDERNGWDNSDVYAQRVNSTGVVQWTTNGVAVCNANGMQKYPTLAEYGTGGAFVIWQDSRDFAHGIYAQRLDAAGAIQWPVDGDSLAAFHPNDTGPAVISDGSGGAITTWIGKYGTNQVIRAQRIDANGVELWIAGGVPLCSNVSARNPTLVSDDAGGAIVAWEDATPYRIMAAYVSGQGWATEVGPARSPSLVVADVYPNPFSGTASIAIEMETSSALQIDIFDVAGRKVRSIARNEAVLSQVVELGDRDDAGRLLPSGVYFCRVGAANETVTRKMVIAR